MIEEIEIVCLCYGFMCSVVVCGYLIQNCGLVLGFVENSDDFLDRQVWCYVCEMVYQQEQDMMVCFCVFVCYVEVCLVCYDEIKVYYDFDVVFGGEVSWF